ncbi:hypothetical protein PRIPAC_89032 [Pristionchus pacificus]|uniref:G protein-coupled receptor n=1 Tax=Pristionchus pacificus TaxID=54126 RepID=A0A2A6CWA7_PRIPA|nr:hypothetical protein PRIPAC_89032 [Pristionchus pacificus]|eukprot:PDM82475.1 G protein-coupled receptor [Pristionchus pacificus]
MIFYEICLISHVFISANRFFAVFTPLTYSQLFSIHNTRLMIGGFWLFSVVSLIYKFKTGDCSFYLPQGVWMFAYTDKEFCQNVRTFDFFKFITYVVIIGALDFVTIVKISFLRANNMIGSTVSSLGATKPAPPKASTVRRNLQMNLVYQVKLDVWFIVILCNREFRRKTKKIFLCVRSN